MRRAAALYKNANAMPDMNTLGVHNLPSQKKIIAVKAEKIMSKRADNKFFHHARFAIVRFTKKRVSKNPPSNPSEDINKNTITQEIISAIETVTAAVICSAY